MRFLVSACLLGSPCKYNGGDNYNLAVERFLAGKEYMPICPEVDGGLPTPRAASEIQGGTGFDVLSGRARVETKSGRDVSAEFTKGANQAVLAARDFGARAAILKERSPSCGVRAIYRGDFSGVTCAGSGVSAAALAEQGLLLLSEENLPGEEFIVDYVSVTEKIVSWLQEKVNSAGAEGCVLGLSGGIDSAVVAALAKKAFPEKTIAVILPVESRSEDVQDAWLVARELDLQAREINLDKIFHNLVDAIEGGKPSMQPGNLAVANVKPRLRMISLYYLAARNNCLVVGTGNKSEIITGFFTKYGDGGVDLEPIGELVKTQVYELAKYLGIPEKIIAREPTAGLWPGQTDEAELGFTYRQLDEYILSGSTDADATIKIRETIRRSRHKQEMPPTCPL